METVIAGNIQGFKQQDAVLIISTAEAQARIYVYSPSIIRVTISKKQEDEDPSYAVIREPLADFDIDESAEFIKVNTSALKLVINKSPLRFNFFTADDKPLSQDDNRFGTNWQGDRVITYRKLYPDEKFIGLGEKTGDLNRRGTSYTNWNTDAVDYGLKSDPLYKTFPFFVGLHSGLTYGLFLDNIHKSYFDFGATTDDEMSWFGADGGDMNYYFFGAQGVAKIIEDYTWLTGRMEMPPLWSLGYQQCRWSYMSAKEVLKIAKTFRKKKIPADVVYCDIDYMEGFKIFTWNKKTFADPKGMMDELKAMNFHLVTIVDPGIKIEEGYRQYDEGIANDYFAKYPDGENYTGYVWPGRCHFPDFFRDDVREWWGAAFTALTDVGVDGFWNDMNEPAAWGQNMPWLVKFGDKYMPEVRNAYGMQMARATYNGTRTILNNKRPFVLTRAAYAGTQRYSAVWTGDNTGTDEHMLLGQRLVNSLGITGISFTGVDIGGFSGNPTPGLMVRWNSLGVYTPMFRNHAIKGSKMREPWEWGKANERIIKKDIEQRYRLLPYIYSGFYQSALTGLPISRTLAIEFPFDEKVYYERFQNQFMFGDALLVAPVESDKLTTDVYLHKGDWYRLSTDEKLKGGKIVNAPSPLTDLPVFVKAGAIIPMQSVLQNTTEKGDGILQLHVWNGKAANEFVYYEDDGNSYDYENGFYYRRTIRFDPKAKKVTLSAVVGNFASRFSKLKMVWHGFEEMKITKKLIELENEQLEIFYNL
ncbi:glycoside hydrolase family 31 protein [Mucilaginibacter dorajii]|uniref:Glycoside hydrolase family 31 protein n=1 Tax=Mucilaginibacter dorajii TaxID=692994 RepID=A0ABP7Q121_9SPHI|nr:glycoside hydrolase family 31 protein [Mucilaginibacter dorajii]MCS3732883.1 alpha-glucosidase [Mucilaginibacter dorajii]